MAKPTPIHHDFGSKPQARPSRTAKNVASVQVMNRGVSGSGIDFILFPQASLAGRMPALTLAQLTAFE